jgi:flagellar motor switch protein FliN/FliY
MTEPLTDEAMLPTETGSWSAPAGDQEAEVSGISDAQAPEGPATETPVATFEEPGAPGPATPIAPVALDELPANGHTAGAGRDLRLLADIRVEVTVEMGRVRLPLRDLLRLTPGAVLELDRAAGDAVDVLVNGTPVARGEVFVVDGDFGVRITEILRRP